jgi:hypothetical protein
LAAAANTVVDKCGVVVGRERVGTDMVGVWMVVVATILTDGVDITAATLWPLLLLLLLGLGAVGVLEVVGTADTTATTLFCPVTI